MNCNYVGQDYRTMKVSHRPVPDLHWHCLVKESFLFLFLFFFLISTSAHEMDQHVRIPVEMLMFRSTLFICNIGELTLLMRHVTHEACLCFHTFLAYPLSVSLCCCWLPFHRSVFIETSSAAVLPFLFCLPRLSPFWAKQTRPPLYSCLSESLVRLSVCWLSEAAGDLKLSSGGGWRGWGFRPSPLALGWGMGVGGGR